MAKKYISKINKGGNNLYVKDTEAQQNISSHAGNTSNPHSVTKSQVGLGNVTNDAQVKRSEMGAASGVATLDSNGKVPSSQLPSYVDDVIEGYFYNSKFYKESTHTTEITGETGKIYVDLSTNKTYRWSGSAYAVISETLALGETSSTAYRGDRGKIAYTHSQTTSGNPHNVTKSDVGLGNVGNFKAVSTVASQSLTDTEKSNARANIGAGTSSFSGSYNDLSNKPTIPAAAANGTYTVKTLVGDTTTDVSDFTANQSSADDVTFVQGSNVTITPDTTSRKITIAAKDTTYSSKAAKSGGTDVSLVTTGEKYTWNSKTSNTGTVTKVTAGTGLTGGDITTSGTIALATSGVTAGTYKRVTVDAYGRVTSGDNTDSDTKNTAGTTNKTGTKMFLAAATEQGANPQTYSNSNCYIGTDNCLYSGGAKVLTSHDGNNRKAFFGTCETAAGTKDKAVTLAESAGWPGLVAGVIVGVKFTNTNTYASATDNPITLNVNSTGAKNIWFGPTHSGAGNTGTNTTAYGRANYVNYYMYDGTYWAWLSSSADNNTTYTPLSLGFCYGGCSTAAGTAAKTVTMKNYNLVAHGIVAIKFDNAITVASATLNINSKGAKAIYYKGSALAANVIQAGDIVTMQYNGSQYHIISIIRNSGLPKTDLSSEVQESLTKADETQLSTAYIGAGASAYAVAVAANLKSNLRRGAKTSVTASSNKLWILTPSTYADPTILMGGVEVPMTAQSNTTVSGVTYKVWSSNNTYTGTFNVVLL